MPSCIYPAGGGRPLLHHPGYYYIVVCSMSRKNARPYWNCACGRWTWASKSACIGCQSSPPAWVQQRQAAIRTAAAAGAEEHTTEGQPSTKETEAGWFSQPRNKRAQAKTRAASAIASVPGDAHEISDDEMGSTHDADMGVGCVSLAGRLESAQDRIRELEAIGVHARAVIQNYDGLLADAVRERDQLVREKRAQRPVQWRLVQVERHAKSKAAQVHKCSEALRALRKDLEALQGNVVNKEEELQRLRSEQSSADAAVASVHTEIAAGCSRKNPADNVPSADVRGFACGLCQQIEALPNAIEAGNAVAAVEAVRKQMQSLLGRLDASTHDVWSTTLDEVAPVPPSVVRISTPTGEFACSGRRGTSPPRSACSSSASSDEGSERRRTRSPARRLSMAERAATDSSRRLEDCGFQPVRPPARSDPYEDDKIGASIVGQSAASELHG